MTKTARQLDAEIAEALKETSVKNLFAWKPKLVETVVDIKEGRLSHASGHPLRVSRLDSPRGAYFIIDGHHRAVEAIQAKKLTVLILIDPHVPRIERAGGSYRSYIDDKVNVYQFLQSRR